MVTLNKNHLCSKSEIKSCALDPALPSLSVCGVLDTLYGRKNSLLARRKLDRFPYLQYSTITMSGPGKCIQFECQLFIFYFLS